MTIHDLNVMPDEQRSAALFTCCGSATWVNKMMSLFPMEELVELLDMAEEQWYACSEADCREAFSHHPKIGDMESLQKKFASTAQWASDEQKQVSAAKQETLKALHEANRQYEDKFGYIFIVSASGKSAEEMLNVLHRRLGNSAEEEINIAKDEQNKITLLRLQKLVQ